MLQLPDGTVRFYDGQRFPSPGSWVAWTRNIALPARAIGHFALPLSTLAGGTYHWHVVVTERGTYRGVAKAATGFTIGP